MSIDDFISSMGVLLYGKERFFRQDDGRWYDREHGDYVSTAEILKRICERYEEELKAWECEV